MTMLEEPQGPLVTSGMLSLGLCHLPKERRPVGETRPKEKRTETLWTSDRLAVLR